MNENIRGMIVPIVTPLTDQHEVDVSALKHLCDVQIETGVNAIFVLGTTGEFYGLSRSQRQQTLGVVVDATAGRIPVIAGISGDSTASSLEAFRDSNIPGVSGFVSSTPYFFSYTQEELLDHFRALADAAGKPLILYNYPGRYRHLIEVETIGTLLAEKCAFAIKDTQGDLQYMQRLLELKKSFPEFRVFEGALPNLALSGPLGIDGSVQAIGNLLPYECARLWSLIEDKEWTTLENEVSKMWAFHQAIENVGIFISALKGCMSIRGWCEPVPARPTAPVGPEQLSRLRELLHEAYE